jgi:hypothetical protein
MSGAHDDFIDSLMMANYSRVKFLEQRPIRVKGLNKQQIRPTFGGVR